ncbi:F-box domain containing protein [Parasponia andersonii]|uniref:F-box domain containing protein n=1 Tax=Parasponia andersonii TaxID=3476 RepID=A0A2P5DCW5_PARAD|nr:F-box domain containing protein [Parasponia andersonii]
MYKYNKSNEYVDFMLIHLTQNDLHNMLNQTDRLRHPSGQVRPLITFSIINQEFVSEVIFSNVSIEDLGSELNVTNQMELTQQALICGLQDDIALFCLTRVPPKYHRILKCVSRRWRDWSSYRRNDLPRNQILLLKGDMKSTKIDRFQMIPNLKLTITRNEVRYFSSKPQTNLFPRFHSSSLFNITVTRHYCHSSSPPHLTVTSHHRCASSSHPLIGLTLGLYFIRSTILTIFESRDEIWM